jgi:hypothetical protein
MSSIIRDGGTYHGISVFGRGAFTHEDEDDTMTYAGQCKDGHACGLGVVTYSGGTKVYTEHGPDEQYDGRCLYRWVDAGTYYCLFERGKRKESADVFANGRCMYNFVDCAPDDPRLLALIAQVAPVEVRPDAPAPATRHSPATRPQAIVRWICRLVLPPQALAAAVAHEVQIQRRHAVAGIRATQPNSSQARPRSGACAGRDDVGGARVGPSCTLTTAHLVHTKPR